MKNAVGILRIKNPYQMNINNSTVNIDNNKSIPGLTWYL